MLVSLSSPCGLAAMFGRPCSCVVPGPVHLCQVTCVGETSLHPDRTLTYDTTHAVFLYGEIVVHPTHKGARDDGLFMLRRPNAGVPFVDFELVHQALFQVVRVSTVLLLCPRRLRRRFLVAARCLLYRLHRL